MADFLNLIEMQGSAIFGSFWPLVWTLIKIVIIVLPMFGAVAYLTLWERKLIGQPMRGLPLTKGNLSVLSLANFAKALSLS